MAVTVGWFGGKCRFLLKKIKQGFLLKHYEDFTKSKRIYCDIVVTSDGLCAGDPVLHLHHGAPPLRPVRHDPLQRGQQHLPR